MPSNHRRVTRSRRPTPESIAAAAASCAPAVSSRCRPKRSTASAADATSDARGRGDLRGQGTAELQSADRPFRRSGGRRARGHLRCDAKRLARAFWPGPLTLVRPPRRPAGSACSRAPASTALALRAPAHPIARALIAAAGVPLAAPSANRSGRVSPTRAEHVAADLDGRIDLDPRRRSDAAGIEFDDRRLPRRGAASAAPRRDRQRANQAELGIAIASEPSAGGGDEPIAPGLLKSHYAPRAALRLAASRATREEAALDFGGALSSSPAQGKARSVAGRRSRRGGRQPVRLSAGARRHGRATHRGRADPRKWSRRGDQRPPAPRRRATGRRPHRLSARGLSPRRRLNLSLSCISDLRNCTSSGNLRAVT